MNPVYCGIPNVPDAYIAVVSNIHFDESYPVPYLVSKIKPGGISYDPWYLITDDDAPYMVDPKRKPHAQRGDIKVSFYNFDGIRLASCHIHGTLSGDKHFAHVSKHMAGHSTIKQLAYAFLTLGPQADVLLHVGSERRNELLVSIGYDKHNYYEALVDFVVDEEFWGNYSLQKVEKPHDIGPKPGIISRLWKIATYEKSI